MDDLQVDNNNGRHLIKMCHKWQLDLLDKLTGDHHHSIYRQATITPRTLETVKSGGKLIN